MTATAQQEVESLDRVLTRLATTEESNLEKVGCAARTCLLSRIPFAVSTLGQRSMRYSLIIFAVCLRGCIYTAIRFAGLQVLSRLLPIVIGQLKSPHDLTRKKVDIRICVL